MTPTDNRNDRRVTRLGELPQAIEPPEGLWLRIEAELKASAAPTAVEAARAPRWRPPYWAAAAVVIALLTGALFGALGGRWLVPVQQATPPLAAQAPPQSAPLQSARSAQSSPTAALPVSFMKDPRYLQQRAQLLASLAARVAALPPPTRQKVLASLATLQQSMRDLQAALGRDPSNALLQELLVDTCQDEMRVLVSVNEAGQDATQL